MGSKIRSLKENSNQIKRDEEATVQAQ
ncbi:uncharacterized protein G2W53_000728 [Senna tora]|uniref:Uncharacterized protein n=1 Tax=Senna tora TaxID=362788 RepID=A0A834XIF5_9FABA|nr:uncharacterized protein G2W53_000728 [Senna tora]